MKIEYKEYSIKTVMEHFTDAFNRARIVNEEWFIDPVKGVVVFKLYVKEDADLST